MNVLRALPLAAVLLVAAGCGATRETGSAALWVTRDRGSRVLHEERVPAGLTVLQALRRKADVETRFGGRFVQSIDGLEGSLSARRDWFFFVNGVESDRGAAEYRLREGDVAWWDLRSWRTRMAEPVVVGAFPEPFVHGWNGKRRPAAVRFRLSRQRAAARALGRVIRASSVARSTVPAPRDANVLRLETGRPRFLARLRTPGAPAGAPVDFVLAGDAARLARDPSIVRFRYAGLP